ncbi:MAG: DUF1707 domain-containing protein [Gemmatimonadota bacterium]
MTKEAEGDGVRESSSGPAQRGKSGPPPSPRAREAAIDALCESFAQDVLELEEFERRVDAVHRARTSEDLKRLLHDLPGEEKSPSRVHADPFPAPDSLRPSTDRRVPVDPGGPRPARSFAVACLSGTRRRGRWRPGRTTFAFAFCGGVELDLRDAVLGPGVTEIQAYAIWGGVEIIVPPGVNVETHGLGLMGGFDYTDEVGFSDDPDAPTLRISGVAVMGGVDVNMRLPGESARDARRRRKLERKARQGKGRGRRSLGGRIRDRLGKGEG